MGSSTGTTGRTRGAAGLWIERKSVTGESLDVLAEELDQVLAGRPQDPAAVAVLERTVAACRSDPAAADRWHEPELLDELVDV